MSVALDFDDEIRDDIAVKANDMSPASSDDFLK